MCLCSYISRVLHVPMCVSLCKGYISQLCLCSVFCLGCCCLREFGSVNAGLDDPGVDGQDGENDAGQKHQGQLVDVLHAHKHHRGHGGQQDGAVHTHVVQQGGLCFGTLQALQGKDGRFGCYVDLK